MASRKRGIGQSAIMAIWTADMILRRADTERREAQDAITADLHRKPSEILVSERVRARSVRGPWEP